MKAAKADFCSGLAFAGLGSYVIFQASRWEYVGSDGPGPGFFPLWYGIVMVALSLFLVVSSVKTSDTSTIDWTGAGRAFATWAALVVAVALMKWTGFAVAFAALTCFIACVMYRRRLWVGALAGVVAAAAFYAVFALALDVKLP
ncbi:MAG TPA: tripartite tricarboxylate transporter TctB family protein [Burkholderiales bacterium]